MPSPFPGMNPYLEQDDTWDDFHPSFIVQARNTLSPQVGPNYLTRIVFRDSLHELSAEERRFAGQAVETQREAHLEIYDRRDRRAVTVLELLSMANKTPGPDHDAYVGKRRSLLASQIHLVEIDLRRGGTRPMPPELPSCDYYALVSRYEHRPDKVDVWPIRLRERLPVIPIPLTAPDPDVQLDLQSLLHRVYDDAEYGKYIYMETPQPPLAPDDDAWARSLVPPQASG